MMNSQQLLKERTIAMKTKVTFAIVSVSCVLVCCHAAELTRAEAKKIIEKVRAEQSFPEISLSNEQSMKLFQLPNAGPLLDKVFVSEKSKPCLPDRSDMRLMSGQFVLCPKPVNPDITWQKPGGMFSLKTPIKSVIIEVTGITDAQSGPSDKIVEYTWQFDYSSFPKEVADALKLPPRTGKSLLRRYDDGWRFVEDK